MITFDEEFKRLMEYYLSLLNEDDLLPFRKTENLPSVLALNLLNDMRRDINEVRNELMEALRLIQQLPLLDELDEKISKNIRALTGNNSLTR